MFLWNDLYQGCAGPIALSGGVVPDVEPGIPRCMPAQGLKTGETRHLQLQLCTPVSGILDIALHQFIGGRELQLVADLRTARFAHGFTFAGLYLVTALTQQW